MPDILGATNPVPGYDKANVNRNVQVAPDKVQIQNSPDLTKVSRADGKTEWQDSSQQENGRIRYDSNFQTFVQRLQNTPDMVESLVKIFLGEEKIVARSGLKSGISAEMAQIISMLQMDKQQLTEFLTGQMKSGSRLNGALFALLRNAYAGASSATVREDILQFTKHYLDYASTGHVEGNILRDLSVMTEAIPASWAENLRTMLAQLENGVLASDRRGNILLLQKTILPYISRYVEQTHDMGLPRELSTMLALNTARYDSGSLENVLSSFHRLASYGTLKDILGQIDDESLMLILQRNQLDSESSAARFADELASMTAKGLRGASGPEVQQAYQNLVQAMLLNESVYMPLNHYLIPLQGETRMLFSEMWVDPDAEEETERGSGRRNRTTRVLIKMDVQNLGLFDIILQSKDNVVDVSIMHPATVSEFSKQIEGAVTEILTRNELNSGTVMVRKMENPVSLTGVFPKIFEGMNSVNVKV